MNGRVCSCLALVALCHGGCAGTGSGSDGPPVSDAPADTLPTDAESGDFCLTHADGTQCGNAYECNDPPVCMQGRCTAMPQPDGTVCAPAVDACHTDGVCHTGVCGFQGTRPDGYNYAAGDIYRCCSGVPSQMNSPQHCGVCGISCGANGCIQVGGAWQCACPSGANGACWSGCCATSSGTPFVCSPSTCGSPASCIPCPGGGTCTMAMPHYYCHY